MTNTSEFSVREIKAYIEELNHEEGKAFAEVLQNDSRKSIQKLGVEFEDFRHKQDLSIEILETIKSQNEEDPTKSKQRQINKNIEDRVSALKETVKEV